MATPTTEIERKISKEAAAGLTQAEQQLIAEFNQVRTLYPSITQPTDLTKLRGLTGDYVAKIIKAFHKKAEIDRFERQNLERKASAAIRAGLPLQDLLTKAAPEKGEMFCEIALGVAQQFLQRFEEDIARMTSQAQAVAKLQQEYKQQATLIFTIDKKAPRTAQPFVQGDTPKP